MGGEYTPIQSESLGCVTPSQETVSQSPDRSNSVVFTFSTMLVTMWPGKARLDGTAMLGFLRVSCDFLRVSCDPNELGTHLMVW